MHIARIPARPRRQIAADTKADTPAVVIVDTARLWSHSWYSPGHSANIPKLDRKAVGERQVDRPARDGLVETAIADFAKAADFIAGLGHDDVDRAAGRIAPEQCALRTAQDLDAFDIEQRQVVGILPREIDIVDIGSDGWVEGRDGFGRTKSAQEIGVGRTDAGVVLRDQIRDILADLQMCWYTLRFELLSGKGDMAMGTSCTFSSRRCAVTTISAMPPSSAVVSLSCADAAGIMQLKARQNAGCQKESYESSQISQISPQR